MGIFHSINGTLLPHEQTFISPFDLGLLRGYGVFDFVRLYKGTPFHLEEHLKRLRTSARDVHITIPYTDEQIATFCKDVAEKNAPVDAGLRLVVTGGEAEDCITPQNPPKLIILFQELTPIPSEKYEHGLTALTNPMLRLLPHVKSTNYMPAVFGMRDAQRKGFDDALYITEKQEILEGTTSNVFFIKDGVLKTVDSDNIVKGVTRKVVLELAENILPIEFCPVTVDELPSCQEAFLSSSIKGIIPLVQINETPIGSGAPGPLTKKLLATFNSYVENYTQCAPCP